MLFSLMAAHGLAQKHGIDENSDPKGLQVGDAAPEIELISQAGESFSLNEQLKKGPVVLFFYRGNWCPYCTRYLSELAEALPDIRNAGAELIGVSPESEEELSITHKELTGGRITLLYDSNDEIMKSYDVAFLVADEYEEKLAGKKDIDLREHNQQEEAMLPVAATYIINSDGMISYRHFDPDYSKRADIKEILAALENI